MAFCLISVYSVAIPIDLDNFVLTVFVEQRLSPRKYILPIQVIKIELCGDTPLNGYEVVLGYESWVYKLCVRNFELVASWKISSGASCHTMPGMPKILFSNHFRTT